MKLLRIFIILLFSSALFGFSSWPELQKDLSQQASTYRNSPLHQELRQNRDTRSYNVGDTKTFWRWNLSIMPPSWIQTPATCRAVGEHSYIFVADSEWNLHIDQSDLDTIMVRLEDNTPNNPAQGAIEMDTGLFGPIPDELDNDPRLIVFYSALGSFQGTSFDGYFSAYNQVTEAEAQQMNPPGHSNECEMIYMTCYPLDPVAPIRLSVLAHELEHLIHWGQDANEQAWIDEGCAELAMVAYGLPDPISGFNSNPDNNLTVWNQAYADYVKVMLFFTYLQEHYDQTGLISALIADQDNGINSLEAQLALFFPQLSLSDLLRDWTLANALDEPQPGNGLYNYEQLNLPVFYSTSMNANPIGTNLTVNAYAADYLSYANPELPISFSVQSSSPLYVSVLLFDAAGTCTEVISGQTVNQIDFSPFANLAARVVFVVTNPNAVPATYSYSPAVANSDLVSGITPNTVMNCFPNPWKKGSQPVIIELKNLPFQTGKLEVYNLKGQLISKIPTARPDDKGALQISWNGLFADNQKVPAGIYLLRFISGHQSLTEKLTILE